MEVRFTKEYRALLRALQKIMFELRGIEESELTKAEKNILRIAREATGKPWYDTQGLGRSPT